MTESEASECVVMTALNDDDGVLSQDCVNSILENFGVVKGAEASRLSAYSGAIVSDVHAKFQMSGKPDGKNLSLNECEHSPRQLAKKFPSRNEEEKKECRSLPKMPLNRNQRLARQNSKDQGTTLVV
jgi:hypothetical protein